MLLLFSIWNDEINTVFPCFIGQDTLTIVDLP